MLTRVPRPLSYLPRLVWTQSVGDTERYTKGGDGRPMTWVESGYLFGVLMFWVGFNIAMNIAKILMVRERRG